MSKDLFLEWLKARLRSRLCMQEQLAENGFSQSAEHQRLLCLCVEIQDILSDYEESKKTEAGE